MVDKEKLAKLLRDLDVYLQQAEELQKIEKNEYLNNWKVHDLVDRKLHMMIETFLSIGDMIISEFKLRKPDTYGDIPRILHENKIIDLELSDKLIDLAKFRNVLVHEYLYLDRERVYEHLQKDPGIIKEFMHQIKEFIKRSE